MAVEKKIEKKLDKALDASVDFAVTVKSTETDPYHETNDEWQCSSKKAAELAKRGWVKIVKDEKQTAKDNEE